MVNEHSVTREILFFKNYAKNEAGRLVPDLSLFFEKNLYEVKASGLRLVSIYFDGLQLGIQYKSHINFRLLI